MSEPLPPTDPSQGAAALSPEQWAQISAWFDEGSELPLAEREAWLAQVQLRSPEAAQLLPWLRQMLAAHDERQPDDWLEQGPSLSASADAFDELRGIVAGARVGPWLLHERLGTGGQATVWRASRVDALPAREVALKLPLIHRDGSQLAARFAREREILARLSHPHIAPLYAAGLAPDGTPWLAMELVQGEPLNTWCDSRQLGLTERLKLFQQVVEAVAYAHARLVLHRDLKPAHMLVTPQGEVKLLDFGIAKLLEDGTQPADATELTRAAGRVMTTAYASPEQVRGEPLTTAADLYALGVVLYELVTGHRPYATRLGTSAQLENAIAEGDLIRAADAVTDADASLRSDTRRALVRQLRGDLGAVLDKALQLDPAKRYASAEALAADLDRLLSGHPVQAAQTSRWQRAWKFTRRHRLSVGLSTLAVCSLVGVTTAAVWQAREAQAQRAKAEASLSTTEHFAFFLGDLLGDALAAGSNEPPATIVSRAERMARNEFARNPETLSRVLQAVAQHHGGIGESAQAAKLYEEARTLTQDRAQQQAIACGLGMMLQRMGKPKEAIALMEPVVADPVAEAVSRSNCASYIATIRLNLGDIDGALQAADESWAYWQAMPHPLQQFEGQLLVLKASILMYTPRVAEADALFARAAELMREQSRDQGMSYVATLNNWALANFLAGQLQTAQARHDEMLAAAQRNAGAQGVAPINYLNASTDRLEAGLYPAAAEYYGKTLQAARAWRAVGFAASAQCLGGVALLREGRLKEAQALLAKGLAEPLTDSPSDRIAAGNCKSARAQFALARGDAAEGLALFTDLLSTPKLRDATRSHYLQWRARAHLAAGDAAAARQDAEAALKIARQLQGAQPNSFRTALALDALARVLAAQQDAAAATTRQEADTALAANLAPTHWLRQ
jgi:serine/threonine-protein kinase